MTNEAEKNLPSVRATKPDGTETAGTWIDQDHFRLEGWDVEQGDEIRIRDKRYIVAEVHQDIVLDPEAPESEGEGTMERKRQIQDLTLIEPGADEAG